MTRLRAPVFGALALVTAAFIGGSMGTVTAAAAPGGESRPADPPYSVDTATLDDALDCDEFTHPDTEPVLLVHGTFTMGHEQWDWNYGILLRETGHDVCILTYPDRGFGDQQISAEYVARAVQRIHAESGQPVDMVGHSQGASMPRWAIKWWPSVQEALDDFVLLAGPVHGTTVASGSSPTGMPPAFWQFSPDSRFIQTLNRDDETPGDVDYTSIYTRYDELVQPVDPPTAALDPDLDNPNVTNILLQDVCPQNAADHLTIGTVDRLTQLLALDALDHDGPTDLRRAGVGAVECTLEPLYVVPETFPNLVDQFQNSAEAGFPEYERVDEEPALMPYAAGGPTGGDDADATDTTTAPEADPAPGTSNEVAGAPARSDGARLAATGRAIPLLATGIAIGVSLLLRAGRSPLERTTIDPGPDDQPAARADQDA